MQYKTVLTHFVKLKSQSAPHLAAGQNFQP